MPKHGRLSILEKAAREAEARKWQTQAEEGNIAYIRNRLNLSRGEALATVLDDIMMNSLRDFFIRHRYYIDQMDLEEWEVFCSKLKGSFLLTSLQDIEVLEGVLPEDYTAKIVSS